MTLDYGKLGYILQVARKNCGLTQKFVADLFGMKPQNLSSWELGKSRIDIDSYIRLCDLYSIDFAEQLLSCCTEMSAEKLPQKFSVVSLSPTDQSLLDAYHRAPQETKDIVDVALRPYRQPQIEEKAI